MSFSTLPLSYCTNVHPGLTVAGILDGLTGYSRPISEKFGSPMAAGLWLARPVIDELRASPAAMDQLQGRLRECGLTCYTFNAFPYGNFHSDRVKEQVYLPDWTQDRRRDYTLGCASILAKLLPPEVDGSISTAPLGFKSLALSANFVDDCCEQLIRTALGLAELRETSGQRIRLAIEPEPCCVLETTPETLQFFQHLREQANTQAEREAVEEHLGVCYDVCHQSVEFEDVAESIRSLVAAEIRINKVHITSAIEIPQPCKHPELLSQLAQYVEPRYLHQTFARTAGGKIVHQVDLDRTLCESPPTDWQDAECWRVHFHVPVDRESLGDLGTTRADLIAALQAVRQLDYAPHLEVETYTWQVLPNQEKPNIVEGFSRELKATRRLLTTLHSGEVPTSGNPQP